MSDIEPTLTTLSGSVIFREKENYPETGITVFEMELDLIGAVASYMPRRWKATFFKGDKIRLAEYLESALTEASLGRGIGTGKFFLTNALDFQVWVVGGEVDEGELSLEMAIMLSNSEMSGDGTGACVGFSSIVYDVDVVSFCQQLRSFDPGGTDNWMPPHQNGCFSGSGYGCLF